MIQQRVLFSYHTRRMRTQSVVNQWMGGISLLVTVIHTLFTSHGYSPVACRNYKREKSRSWFTRNYHQNTQAEQLCMLFQSESTKIVPETEMWPFWCNGCTCCTRNCLFDNFQLHQWQKLGINNISFPVILKKYRCCLQSCTPILKDGKFRRNQRWKSHQDYFSVSVLHISIAFFTHHRSGNWINKSMLTHWGRVTHICVVKLIIIGSDNGLSPGRRQAIIWTNAGILFIGPLGTKFIEILIRVQTFLFKKMHSKMSSAKWRPFCLGLNVLRDTD